MRPHRWQPTRLCHPWDSPGKNTGVGCHFLLQCMKVKSKSEVTQSWLTLRDPMDWSLPGSSVHGIFQARVLEWVAIAFSMDMTRYILFSYAIKIRTVYIYSDFLLVAIHLFLFLWLLNLSRVQFSSDQSLSCVRLSVTPMNCSTPALPVHYQLPEFTQTQTHVHRVGDAI